MLTADIPRAGLHPVSSPILDIDSTKHTYTSFMKRLDNFGVESAIELCKDMVRVWGGKIPKGTNPPRVYQYTVNSESVSAETELLKLVNVNKPLMLTDAGRASGAIGAIAKVVASELSRPYTSALLVLPGKQDLTWVTIPAMSYLIALNGAVHINSNECGALITGQFCMRTDKGIAVDVSTEDDAVLLIVLPRINQS